MAICITACHDAGKKQNAVNPDELYLDYSVSATENGNAVCMLRFRSGGRNGKTVLLDEASKVELDGQLLKPDSASFTGIYYESVQPAQGFIGKHQVVFSTTGKKQYIEDFDFIPFELDAELPQQIERKPFVIRLKNFPQPKMQTHLVMIDTSFLSNDVNEMVNVVNAELNVTDSMLRQISNGPISLELTRDESRALHQRTKGGGRFSMSYGLKRDFELTD